MICSDICAISATRERLADEITPVSVEHSRSKDDNETDNAAANAIDLNLDTKSNTVAGSDGKRWLKINLGKLNCILQVIWYTRVVNPYYTWTCTGIDCSSCSEGQGSSCSTYNLTTSIETKRAPGDDLPFIADCKYGSTVKLERASGNFAVTEIAITGKQGESSCALKFTLLSVVTL